MDPLYFESWQHEDVTLATQCSANHLHHVIELAKRWSGKATQLKLKFDCKLAVSDFRSHLVYQTKC